ncbi:MAG TPA: right-handed parallel beta-helix repeat-containing protein [Ignavibacteriaceae bacterium]|nr:right-handed parallel beta-helix repeat-containing protein [Ignavibacteriaceae bacterium]
MEKIYFVLFAFLFSVSSLAGSGEDYQKYYYVTPTASGSNNGLNWTNAWGPYSIDWDTLNAAIDTWGDVYLCFSGSTNYQIYYLDTSISITKSGKSSGKIIITSGQHSEYPTGHSGFVFLTGKNSNGNYNSGVNTIFDLKGNDYIKIYDLTLIDIIIPTNAGARWLIDANSSDNCIFDSLTLRNTFQWYHADPEPDSSDDSKAPTERNVDGIRLGSYSIVSNCNFSYLDCGVYGDSVSNNTITNCFFSENLMDVRRRYLEDIKKYYFLYQDSGQFYHSSFHYGEGKDIYFRSAKDCTVCNCSLTVKGSSGITIDCSSNMTITNNCINTVANFGTPIADYNLRQVDCIKVGELGQDGTFSSNELLTIKENTLINTSSWTFSHDDCIQFYTDIDNLYEGGSSSKRYYYNTNNSNVYQIAEIYRNFIVQTSSSDTSNTGIIIGGAEKYNPNIRF